MALVDCGIKHTGRNRDSHNILMHFRDPYLPITTSSQEYHQYKELTSDNSFSEVTARAEVKFISAEAKL